MEERKFEYGDIVKDIITGVEGVITGHADYITGCDQYLFQPKSKEIDSKKDGIWLDENRLKKKGEDKAAKSILKKQDGADIQAPTK